MMLPELIQFLSTFYIILFQKWTDDASRKANTVINSFT